MRRVYMDKLKSRHTFTSFYTLCWVVILLSVFLGAKFISKSSVTTATESIDFIFEPGSTVKGLACKLEKTGVIYSANFLIVVAEITGVSKELHAGEYRVEPKTTLWHLLMMLKNGEVVKHNITLVDGWTFAQIKRALLSSSFLAHELVGLSDDAIMQKIGAEGIMPEGMFAPDTYVVSGMTSDVVVLQNAYQLMQKRLQQAWQSRASNVPYKCPYEALIVASMIEKESAYVAERPLIAGVIVKRLQLGMPLQIDATVIYGLGLANRCMAGVICNLPRLRQADLQKNSSYNTYLRRGLPPTPISIPSNDALLAALHPIVSDKLYYVAKPDGSHEFSSTLAEHNAAKRKYLSVGNS